MTPLLKVDDLHVTFATEDGRLGAVDGVSFQVDSGEILAIVGESGCGKSVTAQTIMGLTRGNNSVIDGRIEYGGKDLVSASEGDLRTIRGEEVAMIFQDPMTSLNPVYTVGDQIVEQIRAHRDISKGEAHTKAVDLLTAVGIPNARDRASHYPHEFSGGMRQRAMVAMALSLDPKLLIADEPTTALDVTIQAQIMKLIQDMNEEHGLGVILITHDLGVVAEVADRVAVMYAGEIVEQGTLEEIFYDPQHPYTWGLLGSLTRLDRERPRRLPQIDGLPPSLLHPPAGCRFAPRCPHRFEKCDEHPDLVARLEDAAEHVDRCWLEPKDKRKLREVEGRIGLEVPVR